MIGLPPPGARLPARSRSKTERSSTGPSRAAPRLRFDLTVNEFSRELTLDRELVVFGEQFWRPYCHVQDLARSIVLALESPEPEVAFEVFNVGDTAENYTKRMIVETIRSDIRALAPHFPHDADYLEALDADFARWADVSR